MEKTTRIHYKKNGLWLHNLITIILKNYSFSVFLVCFFLSNSMVIMGNWRISTLNASVKNTIKCQPIKVQSY